MQPDPSLSEFRTAWWQRLLSEPVTYELTRYAILRALGFVYFFAFLSLALQLGPLLGSRGLLPVASYLSQVRSFEGTAALWHLPSLFWIDASDGVLTVAAWTGVALSALALAGVTNALLQLALWAIYASFVHVGQIFYGYGWELQLLETGLLSVFLCPLRGVRPFPATAVPAIVLWLFRWIVFRVMLGSALIKLRGDPCWRDFTCLDFHFETQPNPNPLAWWMHHAPHAVHAAGVAFNYLAELVAPWFIFGTRRWRQPAGVVLVAFQVSLVASGNLSFLNWLTIVPALACFDDRALARLLPGRLRGPALEGFSLLSVARLHVLASRAFAVVVGLLSVAPVMNLLSSDQRMNASFEPLDIVNTYGAFGSVDRERYEVILEGARALGPDAAWLPYELPCMPGDLRRRPCVVTPYHYRLDWQMWFVRSGRGIEDEPWLVHLVWQLLEGEPGPELLLARDPFRDDPAGPPRFIRAGLWRYRFSASGSKGVWWTRDRVAEVLPPLSLETEGLRDYARAQRWPDAPWND